MNKRIRFYQSVHFKIGSTFCLLLLVSIEIIGAVFIRQLERSTITSFQETVNHQVEGVASNLSAEMAKPDSTEKYETIKNVLSDFAKSDVIEARVVDEKGIIMATTKSSLQNSVGNRNDYTILNDLTKKREEQRDSETGKRVYINVQPITSPTGDAVIGGLYYKTDIESKYTEIRNIVTMFFVSSMVAMAVSVVVLLIVSGTITKPIGEMKKQAKNIANGDYSSKIKIYGNDELSQLGDSINSLSIRIKETQASVESERNRLTSVLTHMTDGVIATDKKGRVVVINEMALLLFDLTMKEAIGQDILELLDIKNTYSFSDLYDGLIETILDLNLDGRGSTAIKLDITVIRKDNGFLDGVVCVLHDITEQERVERDRREFVSNVSHELRTPLTSVKSYVESLAEGAWQDEEVAPQFLQVVQDETERMIRMINDLLNLSRYDAKAEYANREMVLLNDFIRHHVLERFKMMTRDANKKYVIESEITTRPIWVEIDQDSIKQVMDNIMYNAIKYSPDGGKITCRLTETHNYVTISVSDEGLGIPKRDILRVFDRFYRVDKARSRAMGGTGLGLAISKEVITAHGGSIWAESVEGKGSTFFITLPYVQFDENEEEFSDEL